MLFLTLLCVWRGWDIGFNQNFIRTQWLISPVCKWPPLIFQYTTFTKSNFKLLKHPFVQRVPLSGSHLFFYISDPLLSFRSLIHLTLVRITCPLHSKCRFRDKQWKVPEMQAMALINDVCHKHICCFCVLIALCVCVCVYVYDKSE